MKKYTRAIGVCVAVLAFGIWLVSAISQCDPTLTDRTDTWCFLADVTFVPGAFLLALYALERVRAAGTFYLLSYSLRQSLSLYRKDRYDHPLHYEPKNSKKSSPADRLFGITGLVCIGLSAVFSLFCAGSI